MILLQEPTTTIKNLALDVYDTAHVFGCVAVTRDQWMERFTNKKISWKNRERTWSRFKRRLKESVFADDIIWDETVEYEVRPGSHLSGQPMTTIQLGPFAQQLAIEVLDTAGEQATFRSHIKRAGRYGRPA